MLIKEAIEMLKRMNPNDEVFIQFKEDVTEYRNNEHLKTKPLHEKLGMDERDMYYNQQESR